MTAKKHPSGMRGWMDLGSDMSWEEHGGLWGIRVAKDNPPPRANSRYQPEWFTPVNFTSGLVTFATGVDREVDVATPPPAGYYVLDTRTGTVAYAKSFPLKKDCRVQCAVMNESWRDYYWLVLHFDNIETEVGEREFERDGGDRYVCEVKMVDLDELPLGKLRKKIAEFGDIDGQEGDSRWEGTLVYACATEGTAYPMGSCCGMTRPSHVRAEARRLAESYIKDSGLRESQLDKPVNKIGATAREFGRGDYMESAMSRLANKAASGEAVDPAMSLMLKMTYKLNAEEINKVAEWTASRSLDPLPFAMAYLANITSKGPVEEGGVVYQIDKLRPAEFDLKRDKKLAYRLAVSYYAGWNWAVFERAGKLKTPQGIVVPQRTVPAT